MTASVDAVALMNVAASVARRAGDTVLVGRRQGPVDADTKSTPTDMVTCQKIGTWVKRMSIRKHSIDKETYLKFLKM